MSFLKKLKKTVKKVGKKLGKLAPVALAISGAPFIGTLGTGDFLKSAIGALGFGSSGEPLAPPGGVASSSEYGGLLGQLGGYFGGGGGGQEPLPMSAPTAADQVGNLKVIAIVGGAAVLLALVYSVRRSR